MKTLRPSELFSFIKKKIPDKILKKLETNISTPQISVALDELSDCLYRCCVDHNRTRPIIKIDETNITAEKIMKKLDGTLDETSALAQRIQNRITFSTENFQKALGWSSALSVLVLSGGRIFLVKVKRDELTGAKVVIEKLNEGK